MQADERTRVVIHREWVLDTPAHHTEVAKALAVAGQKHDAEPGRASDIVFDHGDDYLIIGYQVEPPPVKSYATTPAAEWDRLAKTVREERDEWQRKAEFAMATVKRVRQLAITWSADSESGLRAASRELHAILDGPGDEEQAR